jgi:hypothetical protein
MKRFAMIFVVVAFVLAGLSAIRADAMTMAVPPPTSLRVSTNPAENGALVLTYFWTLDCPQDVCMIPQTQEIERNGSLAASIAFTLPTTLHFSTDHNNINVSIGKAAWAPGDCFRIRLVAPAGDGVTGHFTYSDYSNRICLPSGTATPAP